MSRPAPRLPELARSLRSFGALGGPTAERAFHVACGPLVAARTAVDRCEVLAEVQRTWLGAEVGREVARRAAAAAVEGIQADPERRASQAEASEIIEPLLAALARADDAARALSGDGSSWEQWVGALRTAFRCADEAARALAPMLARPVAPRGAAGWIRRTH